MHQVQAAIELPEVAFQPLSAAAEPVATSIVAALPPAPVVVGKLVAATAVPEDGPVQAKTHRAGFGAGIVAEPTPQRAMAARAGFGDALTSASTESARVSRAPRTTAVEILSKPRPVYTEEARRLRIEGEVLLEVLFTADGEPRILRVIQGLGYGLDRAAIDSASRIGYRPATRDGEPVDQTAIVHIVFQLAY